MKRNRLRSRSGFTLTEVMISLGIIGIILMGAVSALSLYKATESHQKDRIQSRLLLAQTGGEIMATPHKYPRLNIGGEDGGYVLCFDQKLSPVEFDATNSVGMKKLSDLEPPSTDETNRPLFCPSKFEVRFVPAVGDPLLRVKIYIRNPDQTTLSLSLVSN